MLGVLLDVGNVVLNFTLNNPVNAFDRGVAGSQLRTSYTTLSSNLDAWHQATVNCGQNLTCVTRQDGKAATFFTTFSSQLASTSVPADCNRGQGQGSRRLGRRRAGPDPVEQGHDRQPV